MIAVIREKFALTNQNTSVGKQITVGQLHARVARLEHSLDFLHLPLS